MPGNFALVAVVSHVRRSSRTGDAIWPGLLEPHEILLASHKDERMENEGGGCVSRGSRFHRLRTGNERSAKGCGGSWGRALLRKGADGRSGVHFLLCSGALLASMVGNCQGSPFLYKCLSYLVTSASGECGKGVLKGPSPSQEPSTSVTVPRSRRFCLLHPEPGDVGVGLCEDVRHTHELPSPHGMLFALRLSGVALPLLWNVSSPGFCGL